MDNDLHRVRIVSENDGWQVIIDGLGIAADGATRDAALAETVQALREYAADWHDHLHGAPNHARHADLVRWVEASTDAQLVEWLTG